MITATAGIVVGQLMKGSDETGVGDPSLSLVLPTSRFRCGGRFFAFPGFNQDAAGNGTYVNIVAPTAAISSILLDNATLASAVTCGGYARIDFASGYSWTKCLLADPIGTGTQHILDSGGTPIAAYVYGQNVGTPAIPAEGSYAYVAGMNFTP